MAIAGQHHDHHRFDSKQSSHWNQQNRYQKQQRIIPSKDWRVGQRIPSAFESPRYKVDYRDSRRLSKPNRNHS